MEINPEDTIPPSSGQNAAPSKMTIKTEQEPAVIPSPTPPKLIPQHSAKIAIPLTAKPAKATVPARPNAFTTFSKTQEASRLTRELWDTRRELAAARARESTLVQHLDLLNQSRSGWCAITKERKFPAPRGTYPH